MSNSIKHCQNPGYTSTLCFYVEVGEQPKDNPWLQENWYCSDTGQALTMVTAFFLSMPNLSTMRVRFPVNINTKLIIYGIVRAILEASTQGKGISNELVNKDKFDVIPADEYGLEFVFELEKLGGTGDHSRLSIKTRHEFDSLNSVEPVITTDDYFSFNNRAFQAEREKRQNTIKYVDGIGNLFKVFSNMRRAAADETSCHLMNYYEPTDGSLIGNRSGNYRGLMITLLAWIPFMVVDHQLLNPSGEFLDYPTDRRGYHDVIGMVELGWIPEYVGIVAKNQRYGLAGYTLVLSRGHLRVEFDIL